MYTFYTEVNPNFTFHVQGRPVVFRRGMFETGDRRLAMLVLERCEKWNCVPGTWYKAEQASNQIEAPEQITEPEPDGPVEIAVGEPLELEMLPEEPKPSKYVPKTLRKVKP